MQPVKSMGGKWPAVGKMAAEEFAGFVPAFPSVTSPWALPYFLYLVPLVLSLPLPHHPHPAFLRKTSTVSQVHFGQAQADPFASAPEPGLPQDFTWLVFACGFLFNVLPSLRKLFQAPSCWKEERTPSQRDVSLPSPEGTRGVAHFYRLTGCLWSWVLKDRQAL